MMKTIKLIGKTRAADIPQEWAIHNAPRPLYGTKTWEGDFIHGIFYAAIDPADEFAPGWLKENDRNDAYELVYLSREQAIPLAYQYYQDNFPKVVPNIDLDDPDIVDMMLRGWLRSENQ
jgi:hypothetical protein